MRLNTIYDNYGARHKYKRLGRGIGSGKGKTCARGGKGQTARTGVAVAGFEGGQMPLFMRLPKRGFDNSKFATSSIQINFRMLNVLLHSKKIKQGDVINKSLLKECGLIKSVHQRVKLIATGEITVSLHFEIDGASAAAQQMVEKAGGKVNIINTKLESK